MSRLKLFFSLAAILITFLFELICCNFPSAKKKEESSAYKNLSDTARYMGMQTCRTCHGNVYATFIQTGMGKSWDHTTREKSSATFDRHAYVYDKFKNFWYHPFWEGDSLYIKEFRLEG